MKKSLVTPILILSLINFASAYYGSYSNFSLSNLLNSIDSSTMLLGAVFIVSFAFLNFALLRFFKDNKATAGVIAFVISLSITYWINQTGFNIEGLFFEIGFSGDMLYTILPIILLIGIIIFIWKFKSKALLAMGALLIVLSFTNLIYAKGLTLLIGITLSGIGIWLLKKKRPNTNT